MKKFVNTLIIILSFIVLNPFAHAEVKEINATGTYRMGGDGIEESLPVAKERALEKAKQLAAEEAGFYIESHSRLDNRKLKDKVTIIAASIMELVIEPEYDSVMIDSKKLTIDITCKIKVRVDTDKISAEKILEKDKLIQNVEEKDKRIRELEEEVERLKKQSRTVTSENQQQKIQEAFNENQRQFLIAKYERDIDIYDFSSTINLNDLMNTAQKLSEIDPQNAAAFRTTIFCLREQEQLKRAIDYCKKTLNSTSSSDILIEAYTQLGDIYYNEYNDKAEAKNFINQGISLVKKRYTKSEIEKFVNDTEVQISELELTGRSNSVRELYILKSDIEGKNPIFD